MLMFNEPIPAAYLNRSVLIQATCQLNPSDIVAVTLIFPSLLSHADCELLTAHLESHTNVVSIHCNVHHDNGQLFHRLTVEYITQLFQIHPIENVAVVNQV